MINSISDFSFKFNSSVKFNFDGGDLTSDSGALLIEEFMHVTGIKKLFQLFKTKDSAVRFHTDADNLHQAISQIFLSYYNDYDANELAHEHVLTTSLNKDRMLPFENKTAGYIRSTGNHVMYRITPVFDGDNLVATGVLMEAYSVEDNGQGLCFNVFCYNAQPGVVIDYSTGENHLDENSDVIILDPFVEDPAEPPVIDRGMPDSEDNQSQTYILNKNTKKIHYPWCSSVEDMAEHNKQEYTGDINEMIGQGYSPCKRCNPS